MYDDYTRPRPVQFSLSALLLASLGIGTSIAFVFEREPTLLTLLCFLPVWAWAWGLALWRITGLLVVLTSKCIDLLCRRR